MRKLDPHTPFHQIAILTIQGVSTQKLYHYNILFLLKGTVRVQTENGNLFLNKLDVVLLSPHQSYVLFGNNDNLVLSVVFKNEAFSRKEDSYGGKYVINSATNHHRPYDLLRRQLAQIASVYFDGEDAMDLQLTALAYQLLYYLDKNHYEIQPDIPAVAREHKYSERISRILSFLHTHYREPISLQALSEYTNLSPTYLSRFFKKHMQTNFNQCLSQIRLHYAANDLIRTDASVTFIAQENGFPNTNSFNRLFKEKFHTTPNQYRLDARRHMGQDRLLEFPGPL